MAVIVCRFSASLSVLVNYEEATTSTAYSLFDRIESLASLTLKVVWYPVICFLFSHPTHPTLAVLDGLVGCEVHLFAGKACCPSDVLAESSIDLCLVSAAAMSLSLEPGYDIRVESQRDLLLHRPIENSAPGIRPVENLRGVSRIDLVVWQNLQGPYLRLNI